MSYTHPARWDCVIQGSKSIQKRRREDEAEVALKHEARQQRQQLTSRNHKIVLPKGHDPTQDAREKTLMTVATKYAVQQCSPACVPVASLRYLVL